LETRINTNSHESRPAPLRDNSCNSCLTHPFFLVTFAGGFLWCLIYLLVSPGWSLDDEISHYLRSRSVWENPVLIFDAWTRIGRNLFHIIPAPFGLTAARIWTLLFAAGAVWLTTLLAIRLGVKRAWLIPLALWFQPWFVELSWGVLTQTPFLVALLAGIWFLSGRRLAWSGFCFGLLPLIRHEGIALLGLWALAVTVERLAARNPLALIPAAAASAVPLATYNLAAWICLGELPSRIYFDAKPTEIYGSGPLWHFLAVCLIPAGPFTLVLAAFGLPGCVRGWKTCWPLLFYAAYFGLHSVIFWKGLFASGGYYHFLMPAAPGLAIAAVFGADALLDCGKTKTTALAWILMAGMAVQGFVLLHVLAMQYWAGVPPRLGLAREPIHQALQEALDWQAVHRPHATPIICRHIYAAYSRDWQETPARRALAGMTAPQIPTTALVIWEHKYADVTGLALNDFLQSGSGWKEVATFGRGTVRIFEKADPPASR
jgi:hypothetical protein